MTSAADFYGPEGGYHLFAGRDASRALAKLSFEEADLAQPQIDDLSFAEKDQVKLQLGLCPRQAAFHSAHN